MVRKIFCDKCGKEGAKHFTLSLNYGYVDYLEYDLCIKCYKEIRQLVKKCIEGK